MPGARRSAGTLGPRPPVARRRRRAAHVRGEPIAFWILGPLSVARRGRHGAVPQRRAFRAVAGAHHAVRRLHVHGAGRAFLGFVQIIVYTGAIMMLFLFVLMLTGRESSDSLVEVLRGQRVAAAARHRRRRPADRRRGPGLSGIEPAGLQGAVAGRGEIAVHRRGAVHRLPVPVRTHQRAAHHRGARRDGARPRGAAAQRDAVSAAGRASGCVPAGCRRCPAQGCSRPPRRTPPRRCCRTARSPGSVSSLVEQSVSEQVARDYRATAICHRSKPRTPQPTAGELPPARGQLMTPTYYLVLSASLFSSARSA